MTLRLTPEILRGAYDFMRITPPFRGWKLPDGDDVEFYVGRKSTHLAEYEPGETAEHRIALHETGVGYTQTMIELLAHEMVHLSLADTKHAKVEHGAEFKRRARLVCRSHGFDPKRF